MATQFSAIEFFSTYLEKSGIDIASFSRLEKFVVLGRLANAMRGDQAPAVLKLAIALAGSKTILTNIEQTQPFTPGASGSASNLLEHTVGILSSKATATVVEIATNGPAQLPAAELAVLRALQAEVDAIIYGDEGGNVAPGPNFIQGTDGNDFIIGTNGDDIIRGGTGFDEIHGGAGDDKYVIVGDLTDGGKIDDELTTSVLGFGLSELNGQYFGEDVDGGVIRGGEGNNTLFVFGTADLSNWDLDGIDIIEIRSNVIFRVDQLSLVREVNGTGGSTVKIVESNDEDSSQTLSLNNISINGVQNLGVGQGVTVEVKNTSDFGDVMNLTGAGAVLASDDVDFSGIIAERALTVRSESGSTHPAGLTYADNIATDQVGVNRLGTNGNDVLFAHPTEDSLLVGYAGSDILNGGRGDDLIFGGEMRLPVRGENEPNEDSPPEQDNTPYTGLFNNLGGERGFGDNRLHRNDDEYTRAIDITSVFGEEGLNFFGTKYTHLFVNNNGNITFGQGLYEYTPGKIDGGIRNPIIATFWADVDTRGTEVVPTPGGNSTGSNLVWYHMDPTDGTFTVTWDDVGYYSRSTDKLNAFQLQLVSKGGGDFDIIFNYEDINWTTGSAYTSGGTNGLGGKVARAGYSSGSEDGYYEMPQSGNQEQMLALNGLYKFSVRNGITLDESNNNILQGNGGDDIIVGSDGVDVAVFRGKQDEYIIVQADDDTLTIKDTVSDRDGTDTVYFNVEFLRFLGDRGSDDVAAEQFFELDTTPVEPETDSVLIELSAEVANTKQDLVATIRFGKEVSSLNESNFLVENGTLSSLTMLDSKTWQANIKPAENTEADGVVILKDNYSFDDGSQGLEADRAFDVDTVRPWVKINSSFAALRPGESTSIIFEFSEPVESFSKEDVFLSGLSFNSEDFYKLNGDPSKWVGKVTVNHDASTAFAKVQVKADSFTDLAGNTGSRYRSDIKDLAENENKDAKWIEGMMHIPGHVNEHILENPLAAIQLASFQELASGIFANNTFLSEKTEATERVVTLLEGFVDLVKEVISFPAAAADGDIETIIDVVEHIVNILDAVSNIVFDERPLWVELISDSIQEFLDVADGGEGVIGASAIKALADTITQDTDSVISSGTPMGHGAQKLFDFMVSAMDVLNDITDFSQGLGQTVKVPSTFYIELAAEAIKAVVKLGASWSLAQSSQEVIAETYAIDYLGKLYQSAGEFSYMADNFITSHDANSYATQMAKQEDWFGIDMFVESKWKKKILSYIYEHAETVELTAAQKLNAFHGYSVGSNDPDTFSVDAFIDIVGVNHTGVSQDDFA